MTRKILKLLAAVGLLLLLACSKNAAESASDSKVFELHQGAGKAQSTTDELDLPAANRAHSYIYRNQQQDSLKVTYFNQNQRRFVKLTINESDTIALPQLAANARGSRYGNDMVQWLAEAEKGTLIEEGVATEFYLAVPE